MQGPFQCRTMPIHFDWTIIAAERATPAGGFEWDVYVQHVSGERVPPGVRAMQASEVDAEMARLQEMVEGPWS